MFGCLVIITELIVLPMVLKEVDRFIIWENEKNAVKKDNKVIDAEIID